MQAGELPEPVAAASAADPIAEARVREAFGLPETIPEAGVEAGVTDALAALARGDRERGSDALASAIPTVCERESPGTTHVEGRGVRCHRYDPGTGAEPLPWRATEN